MLYRASEENIKTGHLDAEEVRRISGIPTTVVNLGNLPHGEELLENGFLNKEKREERANHVAAFLNACEPPITATEEQVRAMARVTTCFGYSEDAPTGISPETIIDFYFDEVFEKGFFEATNTGDTDIKLRGWSKELGIVFPGACEEQIALPPNIKLMAKTSAILFCKKSGNGKDFLRTVLGDAADEISLSSSESALDLFAILHELAHFRQAHLEQDGEVIPENSDFMCLEYYAEANADMVALAAFRGHAIEKNIRNDVINIRQVGKAFNISRYWHADAMQLLERPRAIPHNYFDTCASVRAAHILTAMHLAHDKLFLSTEESQGNLLKTVTAISQRDGSSNAKNVEGAARDFVTDYLKEYDNYVASLPAYRILTAMRQIHDNYKLIDPLECQIKSIVASARMLNPALISDATCPTSASVRPCCDRPTPLAAPKRYRHIGL